ncbi:hypothetical protein ACJMK2_021280 [Sinanodonta woodiana]|uniref:C-type lectin domain-containing protein n=1 Tax=Sinanodonta woodiana TaxID=1069815 RepID=A0ABD3TFM1_SINWO
MKLVQTGFLYLTLLVLLPSVGGQGVGFGSIFGILILLIFLAALSKQNSCPASYTHTPNDLSTCIRFVTTPTNFTNARSACQSDGGYLLRLDPATFGLIRQLAVVTASGTCHFWVGAREASDDTWSALNGDPLPSTAGVFFQNATNGVADECGVMNGTNNFLLVGSDCAGSQCYLCQKTI